MSDIRTSPTPDMIVSNGEAEFKVHRVTDEWIYGVKYPTRNRGDISLGAVWMVKVTHETWRECLPMCSEIIIDPVDRVGLVTV